MSNSVDIPMVAERVATLLLLLLRTHLRIRIILFSKTDSQKLMDSLSKRIRKMKSLSKRLHKRIRKMDCKPLCLHSQSSLALINDCTRVIY